MLGSPRDPPGASFALKLILCLEPVLLKTYALIGDPVDGSFSPAIHNAALRDLKIDAAYIAYKVVRDELVEGLESLKRTGVLGFNVTMPHKVAIIPHLDSVAESCSLVGATNTVQIQDGMLRGHNTDMGGFLRPLQERDVRIKGSRVLVFGAGGAARAAVTALAGEGAGSIRICNRTPERAKDLADHCAGLGTAATHGPLPSSVGGGFDMVVNTTSIGMGGGAFPADLTGMPPGTIAYDIVYRPVFTDFLNQAKGAGAECIHGWEMVLAQAEMSFEIWHGVKAPSDTMRRVLLGGF